MTILIHVLLVSALCPLLGACGGSIGRGPPAVDTPALSMSAGKVLAVIGMKPHGKTGSEAADAAWQDHRLAFGLTQLLAESFYETGKFRLVEEKNLPQRQLLEEVLDLFWSTFHPDISHPELASIGIRLEADVLAYGRVGYSRSSGQQIQVGPVGRSLQRLRVSVEVCLYEVSTQTSLCRAGAGEARQEGMGVVYEFRDHRPDFEKSAAGRATMQAVTSAVQALMASIRFTP